MEVSELTLWIARLSVLGLMYLFLLGIIVALLADARAAAAPARTMGAVPVAAPPSATTARRLVMTAGTPPAAGGDYLLTGPLSIGRDAACDIVIVNGFVSARHARIFAAHGQWMVEDLGSTNGTVLNDFPLSAPHVLTPGDRLLVGDTLFQVQ